MEDLMIWIARFAGVGGVVLLVIAVLARLGGRYVLGAFQVTTLLQAAIAALILGCFCFLEVLTERARARR